MARNDTTKGKCGSRKPDIEIRISSEVTETKEKPSWLAIVGNWVFLMSVLLFIIFYCVDLIEAAVYCGIVAFICVLVWVARIGYNSPSWGGGWRGGV